jgi:RND family efflux transporter MFP subunit
VNVVEKDLKIIRVGDSTEVEVDAFPGEKFSGRIARLAPVLDPATRTFPIEIEIPNPTFRLKPGMYARVGITTGENANAIVVPTNAVVDAGGGRRGVFLAQADNTALLRPVEVGIEKDDVTEILSGVAAGDRIVTTGAAGLRDGQRFLLQGEAQGIAGAEVVGGAQNGRSGRGGRGESGGREGGGGRQGVQ